MFVGVVATFVRGKGLDQLHRPDADGNLLVVGQVDDGGLDRPELRQIARDLQVESNRGGMNQVGVEFTGHVDQANLDDGHGNSFQVQRGCTMVRRDSVGKCDSAVGAKGTLRAWLKAEDGRLA